MSPVVFTELSNFEPSRQMGAKPCYPSCCHFGKIQGLNQLGRNLQKLDKQRLASSMAFCQCAITPIAQKDDEASCIGPCCRPSNLGTVTWEVTNPICIRQMNSIEHHKPDPFGCPNFDKSTLRFIFAHLSYVSLGSPIPNQTSLTMELQCIIFPDGFKPCLPSEVWQSLGSANIGCTHATQRESAKPTIPDQVAKR